MSGPILLTLLGNTYHSTSVIILADVLPLITSPHVAGLAAAILSLEGRMTPDQLQTRITSLATASILGGTPRNTTDTIAFNGALVRYIFMSLLSHPGSYNSLRFSNFRHLLSRTTP